MKIRFDGRVVIITGVGGGLGRSHALEFAARGAKVVVNDIGSSHTGDGNSVSPAQKVVDEIITAGGEAVANYDSVLDGEKIVQTALDNFGRIDIVVNNAGILRDKSFHKMTDTDWGLVYQAHVQGAYKVTHAAWEHLRNQAYGRVIFTASAAGLYGNFGQANYAMAKLGLHGLAQTLAIEGRSRNILVNTIAPIAGSRMTETILPPEARVQLKPEYVSPLVLWLASAANRDNSGDVYEVGAGYIAKLRWERSRGIAFDLADQDPAHKISVENIAENWGRITDFTDATYPASMQEAMASMFANLEKI
jgi:NAD(P)-dependent dehydrogenase (short-subunit alcohol dehydrogenase family)